MSTDILIGAELGPEFDKGIIQPNKTRIKLSTGLANELDGSLKVNATVTKTPLYEYRDLWAEESAALGLNKNEWAMGDAGVGTKGLPIDSGWEVFAMYFHADVFDLGSNIEVALMNWSTVGNNVSHQITSIVLASETDGGGVAGNAFKFDDKSVSPIAIPTGSVLGFRSIGFGGVISDARVGVRMRRQIGQYVSDVVFN